MSGRSIRFRRRRGGTLVPATLAMVLILVCIGVELDAGRLFAARHKLQAIADATTMAAAMKLPRTAEASAAGNRITTAYQALYHPNFTTAISYSTNASGIATAITVQVDEQVPMIFPKLMGVANRPVRARSTGTRVVPSAILQGLVPIGVQYDTTFDIPSNGFASPTDITLKRGSGSENVYPGNFGALRFPGDNSGADQWRDYLKYGYTGRYQVGDSVTSKPGNMSGPTGKAIQDDTDSRFNRASVPPYNDDTWDNFDPGNPRIIVLPLVDWTGANGTSSVPIHGFAAFYVMSEDKGDITGRFVRYTVSRTGGPGWDGISVDPTTSSNFDGGLWTVTLTQ
jgi:Flp pilus assembly protein TadG